MIVVERFLASSPVSDAGSGFRGVEERSGEDDERKVTLHLVARRHKALDEQVAEKIARGDERKIAEHFADFFPAAEEKDNTKRNKKDER